MGVVTSLLLRTTNSDADYESILALLDDKIHALELHLSEVTISQRKYTALFTTYTVVGYMLWLVSFFFITWPRVNWHSGARLDAVLSVLPVIVSPLLIFSIRACMQWYYKRYIAAKELQLDSLRKRQKAKVEEMKQKMSYYKAKNLIERYDPSGITPRRKKSVNSKNVNDSNVPTPIQTNSQAPPAYVQPPPFKQDIQPTTQASEQQPMPPQQMQQLRPQQQPETRTWVDRVLDLIVGEEPAPTNKYALICEQCYVHNGLSTQTEYENVQYTCPKCGHFNSKRRMFDGSIVTPQQVVPGNASEIESASDIGSAPASPIMNKSASPPTVSRRLEFVEDGVETDEIAQEVTTAVSVDPAPVTPQNNNNNNNKANAKNKKNRQ